MLSDLKNNLVNIGFFSFLILETLSWLLGNILDATIFTFVGYVLVVGYFIFLIFALSEKQSLFSIPKHLQWIVFLVIPLIAALSAASYLKATSTIKDLTFWGTFAQRDYSLYISLIFFLCVFVIWSCISIVKYFMNRNLYFAYAATCIPIKENSTSTEITVCLIKNKSHNESAWMFPGGHVDITKNYYNEKDESLYNIANIPEKIVDKKSNDEAGLEGLKIISLSDYRGGLQQLETALGLKAPAFIYLFKVNNSANCYSILKHRIHLDFTYISTYSSIKNDHPYDVCEVTVDTSALTGDKSKAILSISHLLESEINKKCNPSGKQKKAGHNLFPDSIPEMIYCACKYYEDYCKKQLNNP